MIEPSLLMKVVGCLGLGFAVGSIILMFVVPWRTKSVKEEVAVDPRIAEVVTNYPLFTSYLYLDRKVFVMAHNTGYGYKDKRAYVIPGCVVNWFTVEGKLQYKYLTYQELPALQVIKPMCFRGYA